MRPDDFGKVTGSNPVVPTNLAKAMPFALQNVQFYVGS